MIDAELLSRQLVRALRGHRSQRALSRHLQYTTNVVYLWESGRRFPTAATFFWLLHRTAHDLDVALEGFLPDEPLAAPLWKPAGTAAFLRHIRGRIPATSLVEPLGVSRHALGRWLRGESEPRLPDLLRFLDATSTRMLDLVAAFVDPLELPEAAPHWERLQAARALTREQPWAPAVLLATELSAYQALPAHSDAWLASRLSLPVETVHTCVRLLVEAGQLRRDGERWARVEVQAVDTRVPSRPVDLKRWWSGVARDRLGEADGTASFTICAVSQEGFEAIEEAQRLHYRAMRSLISASEPGERVVLLNLQTLALDRPDDST